MLTTFYDIVRKLACVKQLTTNLDSKPLVLLDVNSYNYKCIFIIIYKEMKILIRTYYIVMDDVIFSFNVAIVTYTYTHTIRTRTLYAHAH